MALDVGYFPYLTFQKVRQVHFSPEDLRTLYDMNRTLPPFKGWKLPPGNEVEFHFVPMRGQDQADCQELANGRWRIRLAANKHRTLSAAIMTLQHEMVHLHLGTAYPRDRAHHGTRFQKAADRVCKIMGWDRGQF